MRISDWSSDVCSSDLSIFPKRLEYKVFSGWEATPSRKRAGSPSPAPQERHRGVAFEEVEAEAHRLAARAVHAAVALDEQARVVVGDGKQAHALFRSEERRVGQECVGTGRSRWSP